MDTAPIRDFALSARALLTKEAQDLLEGIYGLHPDGHFESAEKLPAVQELAEVKETRIRLEQFLQEEESAGLSQPDTYAKLVKETAFTHLNRLVAFKMIEARALRRGILDKGLESNEFKFYLADAAHANDYDLYRQGGFPQDALGEGPRDRAYRHFLLWLCGETAQEIKVLFDPSNLPSRLFPRPRVLQELLALLNDPALAEAWQPGNEETIGWVYQYFNSEELEKAFRELRLNKKPIEAEEIPTVTQLFTPRMIVQFLVENSLGRLWLEIHPDSKLVAQMSYYVPVYQPAKRVLKLVKHIRMLDPACGSMHFGLVAFDLFYAMYLEELEKAGQPGWPIEPSIINPEEIPSAIVAHNIHGIDLDLRAVQLSALALYLKAKSLNPRVVLRESRLASADIRWLNGGRMEQFLTKASFQQPIFGRILQLLGSRIRNAYQLGSLLRLEQEITQLVDQERQLFQQRGGQEDLFGWSNQRFEKDAHLPDFWQALEDRVAIALAEYGMERQQEDQNQTFFANETARGLRLLELLAKHYDIVVTNPPYLSKMNNTLKGLVANEYPEGKSDLCAAFIQRCIELTKPDGFIGILTMHSFMFLSTYEKLRAWIRQRMAVQTMFHAGPALFDVGNPGTLQTTAFVLRREETTEQRNASVGTYFRLVKEPDAEAKRIAFEQAVAHLKKMTPEANEAWQEGACLVDGRVFRYRQGDFDIIPGSPWVYWITPGLRRLMSSGSTLRDVGSPCLGMRTGDNFRFLRHWWEVGQSRIEFGCRDREEAKRSGSRWLPYMKGGSFKRWYGNQSYVVEWWNDGRTIKENTRITYPELGDNLGWKITNESFYFRRGVTYSYLTSGRFSARHSPGGFIFDVAGSSLFPSDIPLVLGVMNSQFAAFVLKLINPTVNFQVGDLARLPIPRNSSPCLDQLVEKAISFARMDSFDSETTFDFRAPPWSGSLQSTLGTLADRQAQLAETEHQIDEEVYRLYGISDEDRRAIEAELRNSVSYVELTGKEGEPTDEEQAPTSLSTQELAFRWISYAVGIALGRFQPGIESALGLGDFPPETATRLRALADEDGIATLDPDHSDDLAGKVERILEIALGESRAREVLTACLGSGANVQGLRDFLARDFWKHHLQQYRKRPVYWLLQSPKKTIGYFLFHERATRDSLPLIRGSRYLGGKIRFLQSQLTDLQAQATKLEGREKRLLEKEADAVEERLADLEAFDRNLAQVLEAANSRGETVGWVPQIDDGVLINLAPLYALLTSWKAEPKKCWDELAKGSYDWSHTAMRYWPDRVLAKCRTNKSYAIAHGISGNE
jgi:hypothetical protein